MSNFENKADDPARPKNVPVNARLENGGSKVNQVLAASVTYILAFSNGTVFGWLSTTIPLLQSKHSPIDCEPMSSEEASWIGSWLCIGTLVGVPIFSYIGSNRSRKLSGYLNGAVSLIGWLLVVFSSSKTMLYIAVFFAGLAIGGGSVVFPLYIAEITEDSVRGRLSSMSVISVNGGILFAYVLGSYASYHVTGWTYLVITLLFLVAFIFAPESPKYLAMTKRFEEVEKVLKILRGRNNPRLADEIDRMRNNVKEAETRERKLQMVALFKTRGNIKGLIIGVFLCANVQLSGMFAMQSYTVSIFNDAGSSLSPNSATIVTGFLRLIGNLAATILVDKSGRKVLLIVSNIVTAICLSIMGWYLYEKQATDLSHISWVPVACLSIYSVAMASGLGPLCFLIVSEIFSYEVKGAAITLSLISFWGLSFIVARFFMPLSIAFGLHTCFWIFASVCFGGALFAYFVIPETKNRSLESILRELNGTKAVKNIPEARPKYAPVPDKEETSPV